MSDEIQALREALQASILAEKWADDRMQAIRLRLQAIDLLLSDPSGCALAQREVKLLLDITRPQGNASQTKQEPK